MYDQHSYKFNYSEVLKLVNQNQRAKLIKLNEQVK